MPTPFCKGGREISRNRYKQTGRRFKANKSDTFSISFTKAAFRPTLGILMATRPSLYLPRYTEPKLPVPTRSVNSRHSSGILRTLNLLGPIELITIYTTNRPKCVNNLILQVFFASSICPHHSHYADYQCHNKDAKGEAEVHVS